MPRALESIMKELNSVYNPQRDIYNKQINALPGQQEAQMKGLQSAKEDAFNQIVTGANRRGVAFGGIPLEEQQSYLGSSYLPAVANLKNRFIQQKGSLQEALAELAGRQRAEARDIYDREYARELEQQRLEEARRAAARASSGGGGGGDLTVGETAPQLTLRQQWQQEADAGDWNAQVALNYAGDDGRYDGRVNSKSEFDILKKMGIQGNYYYNAPKSAPTGRSSVNRSMPAGYSQRELQAEAMRQAMRMYGFGR